MSPAYGLSNYPSNQECIYKIRNPTGGPLSLNFENFDVDKTDFVQVKYINVPLLPNYIDQSI